MLFLVSCQNEYSNVKAPLFTQLKTSKTGLAFSNNLPIDIDLNILNYMYYYNGGGIAIGDLNNDNLIDIVLSSNIESESVYLNKGNLEFEDISSFVNIDGGENSWTNGVTIVDINNDGLLDIYLSQVGTYRELDTNNKLFICTGINQNGIPLYEEKSKQYGLDFKGFSTQAGFFDYDLDGDLDMYLMNHSLHHNGTFGKRENFVTKIDSISGDKLFRNDGLEFTDVTEESGILSTVIGYGLGLRFADINLDGYPDIYISNDFHENDYLYINNQDGTFKESLTQQIKHTSRFSMGVDIADINNDVFPDILSLDMLPEDPYILKKSEGEDALDIFNFKLGFGYNHQFSANNLQLNLGNNKFKEIAPYAGIEATDWSWTPLIFDMNMDGQKDVFISNGIPKRMNDIDYINFISGNDVQYKIQFDQLANQDLSVLEKIPEIKLLNKFYTGNSSLRFEDIEAQIANHSISYSNSAAYADFDNDGDYDVICNNIFDPVSFYQNNSKNNSVLINLTTTNPKQIIEGTKVLSFSKDKKEYYEHYSTKGFQACMHNQILLSNPKGIIDSVLVIWPNNSFQIQSIISDTLEFVFKPNLPKFNYSRWSKKFEFEIIELTADIGIEYLHTENPFIEFNREPLIPFSNSTEGPALSVGDIDGDGLDDIFIGSAKRKRNSILIQNTDGTFSSQTTNLDSTYEETYSTIIDIDNDEKLEIVVANGGNEYKNEHPYNQAYILDYSEDQNNIEFKKLDNFIGTSSCLLPYDINQDGLMDIFLGNSAYSRSYGAPVKSYIFINNGNSFDDKSAEYLPNDGEIGFIKHGEWADINQDGILDLILSKDWDTPICFINKKDKFEDFPIGNEKGWWNFVRCFDFDNDGDLDIIAGNLGLNSRLSATKDEPVKMYYSDFDNNGTHEQILSYFLKGKEVSFSNLSELQKQIPSLKKTFIYAEDFAKTNIDNIVGDMSADNDIIYQVDQFENSLFINQGNMNFTRVSLPKETQFSSFHDAHVFDINEDGYKDLFLVGNYYDCNIQMGRYDADYGSLLINQKGEGFKYEELGGVAIQDQIRHIRPISINGKGDALVLARNNGPLSVIQIKATQ